MKTNTVNTDSPAEASELGLPTPPCSVSFAEFPKMARLSRECIITEKIDGTNAQILITEEGEIYAGSRTRLN
jgi:hypothetical protein